MMQLEQFEGPFRSLQDLKKVAFTEEYEVETHLAPWDLPSLVHPQPLPAPRRSSGRGRHSRRGGSELAVRLYGTLRMNRKYSEVSRVESSSPVQLISASSRNDPPRAASP
jgi:hypothetical protein